MIKKKRRIELRRGLAEMIDLAWKSGEYDPTIKLNDEEIIFARKHVDMLIYSLIVYDSRNLKVG